MSDTAHRSYPKPVATNNVSDDVLLLQQAMDLVDGDINQLFAAIADLAPVVHTHSINDITGLAAALGGKASISHTHSLDNLSDVDGAAAGATGYVLAKQADGTYGPVSPAAAIGAHEHAIADVLNLETALNGLAAAAQINAAADEAFAEDAMLVACKANGSLIQRSWANIKSAVWTAFGGLLAGGTANPTKL